MSAPFPTIDIVVVTWNHRNWILRCLDAILQTTKHVGVQVMVVDNHSSDGSAEAAQAHPLIPRVIRNTENVGFGPANNQGWRAGNGDLVVFLNPDTEAQAGWLEAMADRMASDESIGVVGAKLLYPDGRIQHAGGIVYANGMTDHRGNGLEDRGLFDEACDVDYVTGAALAIRRNLLVSIGGFDPRFSPAYFEECDLCLAVKQAGYRVVYEPACALIHHESVSVTRASPAFMKLYHHGRMNLVGKRLGALDWLFRFALFELQWFRSTYARGARRDVIRAYCDFLFGRWRRIRSVPETKPME